MRTDHNRDFLVAGILTLVMTLGSVAHAQTTPAGGTDSDLDGTGERSMLGDVVGDFERFLTSTETYIVLGVGLAGSASLQRLDTRIVGSRFNGELPGANNADLVFEAGEVLGGGLIQVGGALTAYSVGRWLGRPGVASLGRDLVRAQLLNGVVTQTLKYSVGRWRPDGSSRRSFPSGHASGTFASATVLQDRYGWKVGVPAFGIAAYVAASRLNENKHYLSDIVFGAAVGVAAGRSVTFQVSGTRFDVTPMAVDGGAGVWVALGGF